ncbi:MAG TPA: glycosyltransferase family 2 protein [Candidatus Saccharimonadales bacterium]|nr:glycosyltransferase family 2 protein [Candidatus Saccharimonadales bacterium]
MIPLYNEAEGLKHFHTKLLLPSLKKTASTYEIIYVNDGSTDSTLSILRDIAKSNKSVKVVNLSRNFGKEIATTAGISVASGDATIIMDGDGQHPPELMPLFVEKWQQGAQVVVGVRNSNQREGVIKRYGSKLFYRLFNSLSESEIIPRSTDYRLIDKVVRLEFNRFTERHRITRGLIDWLGFTHDYIEFDSPARIAGTASYKTSQLIKLALNSFVSLSLKPLFFFGWVGGIITVLSLFFGVFILVEQIIMHDPLHLNFTGPAMLGIFMSFMIGLVLISQAIMATYLSHVHTQTQDRPLFVIDPTHSIGIDK